MESVLSREAVGFRQIPAMLIANRRFKRGDASVIETVESIERDRAATPPDLAALMQAVAADRSREAFSVLFRHFAPRVKAYLMRGGAVEEQAEELAQETLIRVWRKAHQFDPSKAAPGTWIFRIARNLRIDVIRREVRPEFDPTDPALVPEPETPADRTLDLRQQHDKLRGILETLPEDQKQVIMLSFFEDKAHSAIAEQLGLPLGTVKSRIRLAFARVRKALGETE